jgi:DNA-directed RNA polymerase subunit F
MRSGTRILATLLVLGLGGCTLFDGLGQDSGKAAPEPDPALTFEARLALDYLSLLERLTAASPAEQAEIAEEVRRAAESNPTFTNRLRQALVLGLPGHAVSDPVAARAALGALLTTPEGLLPAELALAHVALQDVNARLVLLSENQRLGAESGRESKERLKTLNRLQAQEAENARLRQELEEALAKLEAVAVLERSMAERQAEPKGRQP